MSRHLPGARLEALPLGQQARLQALAQEHGALVRLLGGLQRRVATLQAEHAQALGDLQAEVLRLRAQLVASRTRVFWGLAAGVDGSSAVSLADEPVARTDHRPSGGVSATLAAASTVICQTGCMGHAHPWRDADGQCRRTGLACEPAGAGWPAEPEGGHRSG